jgi:GntR family transcriptional regulator
MAPLDRSLPIPLYHQLKSILIAGIESGEWLPDQQLPTEAELAERFGVSAITVRQGLHELADLGYVRREQGRGTFVLRPKLTQGPRELTSFTEEMRRHRLAASSVVLRQAIVEAGDSVSEALRIRSADPVFLLKRLRKAGGEPIGIQTAYIPAELVSGLAGENLENTSLYELLQKRYGLRPASARETHSAVLLEGEAAELLGVPSGSPGLSAERVTYLPGRKPLELAHSLMRGDRYRIVLDLVSDAGQAGRKAK